MCSFFTTLDAPPSFLFRLRRIPTFPDPLMIGTTPLPLYSNIFHTIVRSSVLCPFTSGRSYFAPTPPPPPLVEAMLFFSFRCESDFFSLSVLFSPGAGIYPPPMPSALISPSSDVVCLDARTSSSLVRSCQSQSCRVLCPS